MGSGWKGRACWAKIRVASAVGGRLDSRRVVSRRAVGCVSMRLFLLGGFFGEGWEWGGLKRLRAMGWAEVLQY
jgi:hypothetical protein